MPVTQEAQAEVAAEQQSARQLYVRPTVETLEVGATRGKVLATPEATNPATGS